MFQGRITGRHGGCQRLSSLSLTSAIVANSKCPFSPACAQPVRSQIMSVSMNSVVVLHDLVRGPWQFGGWIVECTPNVKRVWRAKEYDEVRVRQASQLMECRLRSQQCTAADGTEDAALRQRLVRGAPQPEIGHGGGDRESNEVDWQPGQNRQGIKWTTRSPNTVTRRTDQRRGKTKSRSRGSGKVKRRAEWQSGRCRDTMEAEH